jgi:hypothetical protein
LADILDKFQLAWWINWVVQRFFKFINLALFYELFYLFG